MNNTIKRLMTFLTISLIWSLVWFLYKEAVIKYIDKIPSLQYYFLGLMPTIGILIGSFIVRWNQPNNQMSLTGENSFFSLLIVSVPILILTIIGVPNSVDLNPNMFGFIIGILTMLYAIFEEIGWRGYLQEELFGKYNKWIVYATIGFIWYLWHWYFLREGNDPKFVMIPILIAASFGIGEVAKATKSILICGAIHGLVNILLIYGVIAKNISSQDKLIIFILSLIIWIPILKKIEKKNTTTNKLR